MKKKSDSERYQEAGYWYDGDDDFNQWNKWEILLVLLIWLILSPIFIIMLLYAWIADKVRK